GTPWEIDRQQVFLPVRFYGRVEHYTDEHGRFCTRWLDTEEVMAMPCDLLIPGYHNDTVLNIRLWTAKASREIDLADFNRGDYIAAMEEKVRSETISKVLYPSDDIREGQELRLKQQYFFVAATFQDILRRYRKRGRPFDELPDAVAVQLNDTHPAIAIPELMRLLVDEEGVGWEKAWEISVRTFGYTNHTLMPEALETWPVDILGRVLPRHLEIIYEINHRFLTQVALQYPGDTDRLRRMSLIEEGPVKKVRMAHLAIVGSHRVNGVAALHSRLLRERIFPDFDEFFPGRFINITNGVTPRRWLAGCNPGLAALITEAIGDGWQTDLERLRQLEPLADDAAFCRQWRAVKEANKERLARLIRQRNDLVVQPTALFDVQVKRIHEYKRQLLNVLHVITLYHRLLSDPDADVPPRVVIFAGKAAPSYRQAKLIIRLITGVAGVINHDVRICDRLRVVFLTNYSVTLAESIVPAADLSEQISTAGTEASGTGNMKMALNGALIIGTLDGANIEIRDAVGAENFFAFGAEIDAVEAVRRDPERTPQAICERRPEIRRTIEAIGEGLFSGGDRRLFQPLLDALLRP
ncbi:MAG TPA: glycogen/starch/alpha-glucan phosphorylase, partial [Desulfobacterales bacterium]|nr:glycogen/starch/alpha-glucan phosphorylase [Desulfobacterales bacterium]